VPHGLGGGLDGLEILQETAIVAFVWAQTELLDGPDY
jgi:hypothetical protein